MLDFYQMLSLPDKESAEAGGLVARIKSLAGHPVPHHKSDPFTRTQLREPELVKDGLPFTPINPIFTQIIEDMSTDDLPWRWTSYIRNSPNHKKGNAMDIAPFKLSQVPNTYGYWLGVDPLLTNRKEFLSELADFVSQREYKGIAFFVETDHIHLQLLEPAYLTPFVVRITGPRTDLVSTGTRDLQLGRKPHVIAERIIARQWPNDVGFMGNPFKSPDLYRLYRREWEHYIKRD